MMGFAQPNWGMAQNAQAQNGWPAQQQQQQQPQQQQLQQQWAQQQQQMQQAPQQNQWAMQQAAAGQKPANSAEVGAAQKFAVSGCTHTMVGPIIRGSYTVAGDNHQRRTYKRDAQVNGLDVMVYFWDERDGANFCGWWFGPKVGGDQVWAYHPDKTSQTPPLAGWKVPYDGPVDGTLALSVSSPGGGNVAKPNVWGAAAGKGQRQEQPAQQQWGQQQQQQQPQQGAQWMQNQQQQQQMQEKQQQMQAMRQQQMQEQQKRLEENRRKLEEMRQQRADEQKRKMEELRMEQQKRAEEAKKRQEEAEQKKVESLAMMAVRKVTQKLRFAIPTNIDDLKRELEEVKEKELEKCGSQKENMEKECESAVQTGEAKVKAIQEHQKKMEEQRIENEARLKAAAELCEKRLQELSEIVDVAGEAMDDFKVKADKVTDDAVDSLPALDKLSTSAEASCEHAKEKVNACTEFLRAHNAEMKAAWKPAAKKAEGEADSDKPSIKELNAKISEFQRNLQAFTKLANDAKARGVKKLGAKGKLAAKQSLVKKYDKDKDGLLSRKEVLAYAKGEFKYALPSAELDLICKALLDPTGKGIPVAMFHRVKVAIGIAREKARNLERRDERLSREKAVAKAKETLEKQIEELVKQVTDAENALKALEVATGSLHVKAKDASSREMTALVDSADELAETAKAKVAEAKESITGLTSDDMPELASFAKAESGKLLARTSRFDTRLTKGTAISVSVRERIAKKESEELEKLRADALKVIRYHQTETKLKAADLYNEFDANKDDRVDEQEFMDFFKKCKKDSSCDEISEEDLSRLFAYLDENDQGTIAKDVFMNHIRCYMKVRKETVVTDAMDIKASKTLRRLDIGEMAEVLEGPVKEEKVDIMRVRVKLLKDDLEGWLTPVGNQGTAFLEDSELRMKVLKETIMTPTFELEASTKTLRKLKEGEQVAVRHWMKKDTSSGLVRMQVRANDGKVGWVTAVGTSGAVFLETI
eukprot:TRINITY_DN1048_c0_g1_i5.p1 TRINITY_DN1048_c0_g1~~TRINITY_DN1048_c0_g1_i5.p1  ORF type:complete len:988 (-),score=279.12 TRINITY_DN1048_c0_g1_i5:91-3054(-)